MSSPEAAAAPAASYHYSRIQRSLHWLMAAIILIAIGLGIWSSYLVVGTPFRRALLDVHKSLGMTALALLLLRIAVRLFLGEPLYRRPLDALTRVGAHPSHGALFLLV